MPMSFLIKEGFMATHWQPQVGAEHERNYQGLTQKQQVAVCNDAQQHQPRGTTCGSLVLSSFITNSSIVTSTKTAKPKR